ncbi:hypothetical protein R5W24_000969 [Gemmata sp. JC717]|uniref:hypothetical protein n=1 Tax=Gemmata algarum TaxID=2975278 RepID=UPI0021BBAD95|nr:hypothetical protein [Gemmata algarum]MDY3551889.1 hypothetical protein [Gemmata algarum]
MATTERAGAARRNTIAAAVLLALLLAAVAVVVAAYLSRPAQLGASEEAFRTVDALYTAVRNRDERRLAECERRLAGYRRSGQLPADAADELDRIVANARGGSWEAAAERLYDFMRAQRREGGTPLPQAKGKKQK